MCKNLYHYFLIKKSGLFDKAYYYNTYPDVRRVDMDPIMHYIKYGWKEGRNPSIRFNTHDYWDAYPEIMEANQNPLIHHIKLNKKRCDNPCEDWSVDNRHTENIFDNYIDELQPVHKGFIFISHEASKTGAPINLLNLCKTYKNNYGNNLIIISVGGGPLLEDFEQTTNLINLDRSVIDLTIDETIKYVFHRLFQLGYRYCVANTVLTGEFIDILKSIGFNTLILIHELPNAIEKLNCNSTAMKIANSQIAVVFAANFVAEKFQSSFNLPREFSHVLPQGVRDSMIFPLSKSEAKKRLLKKLCIENMNNPRIFLGSGVAQHDKGTDLFLEVAEEFYTLNMLNNNHFLWLGNREEEYTKWVNNVYPKLPYKSNVHFLDFETDPAYIFAGSDLFLLTSRFDAFPSVALEALANNTPVLMFKNTSGIEEILDGKNGIIIPNLDSKMMANSIIQFLEGKCLNNPFKTKLNSYKEYLDGILSILENQHI